MAHEKDIKTDTKENKFKHGQSPCDLETIAKIRQDKRWHDGGDLLWLYVDMNSFFASCEQQDNVKYRKRPLIVVPTMTKYTGAIAASYEAKHLGIKTGTSVIDAMEKCPDVLIVEARPDRYVDLHHQIMDAIDKIIPIDSICSIDEFACLLTGPQRFEENACEIARRVQRIIIDEVGECLTASVGVAPSKLLAKTAADIRKPFGITILRRDKLPGILLGLKLDDFAGIGASMFARLDRAGIKNVAQLWEQSPTRLRQIWGGIIGENFYYALHGFDPPPTLKKPQFSISHSHILAPELRPPEHAHGVARRLVAKCGSRLRRMEYKTPHMYLSLRFENKTRALADARFDATSDSFKMLDIMENLWVRCTKNINNKRIKKVSIACSSLMPENDEVDLLGWAVNQADDPKKIGLLKSLDKLNKNYGKDTVTIGPKTKMHNFVGAKIAFNRVPDFSEFRE